MSLVRTRRKMKYLMPFVWMFVVIFVVGSVFFYSFNGSGRGGAAPSRSGGGAGEGLFARVNGEPVTDQEFASILSQTRDQFRSFTAMGGQGAGLDLQAQIPVYAWNQILQNYAQQSAAQANGVRVSEGDARAESDREVEERLRQLGEGSTQEEVADMRARLLEIAEQNLAARQRGLAAQKLQEKLKQEARPVEVKAAHIQIKTEGRSDAAARQLAQDLARRARSGEDFGKLARDNSQDFATKTKDGLFGWVSAQPAPPPSDRTKKADPNAGQRWEPELMAAALRARPGQVTDPIKTAQGYEIVKVLEERPFTPTDPAALKDPKKRDEAIAGYKDAAGQAIFQGIVDDYRNRLRVEPLDPWLIAHQAEEDSSKSLFANPGGKVPTDAQRLAPVIADYQKALDENSPVADEALAFKLAKMYEQGGQKDKALAVYEKWANKGGPEMLIAQGELLEGLKRKTDALKVYQDALDTAKKRTSGTPDMFKKLAEKFKGLNRTDLAAQATKEEQDRQREQLAQEKERERRQQEMLKTTVVKTKGAEKPGGKDTSATEKTAPKAP